MKYAIRVIDEDGNVMFIRHGAKIGEGPVATFRTRHQAQEAVDALMPGLDGDEHVRIVLYGAPLQDTVLA